MFLVINARHLTGENLGFRCLPLLRKVNLDGHGFVNSVAFFGANEVNTFGRQRFTERENNQKCYRLVLHNTSRNTEKILGTVTRGTFTTANDPFTTGNCI